jgi:FixJ family two-component response regulator
LSRERLVSIVDDDPSVCKATARLPESHGYATSSFASAEEFLQSRQIEDTLCLVSDVRMPGLSGIELQRLLIEAGRHIPTVFVTAYPEGYGRVPALNDGAVDFLPKPVNEERLITCVESALLGATPRDAN